MSGPGDHEFTEGNGPDAAPAQQHGGDSGQLGETGQGPQQGGQPPSDAEATHAQMAEQRQLFEQDIATLMGMSPKERETELSKVPSEMRELYEQALAMIAARENNGPDDEDDEPPTPKAPDAGDKPKGDAGVVTDLPQQTDWEKAMQLIAEGKNQEAGKLLGVGGEQLASLVGVSEKIGDQQILSAEDEQRIVQELTQYNETDNPLTQEKVGGLLATYHPNLDPNTKQRIVDQLKLTPADELANDKNITDKDVTPVSSGDMMKGLEKINEDITLQLLDPDSNLSDAERKRLGNLKVRSVGLFTKVHDYFRPGEAGHDFARRLGKTLYWTLMIAFILLVAELNMINNMAGKGGGRR